jgi:NAD(P) transhydrogenase subunit beta
MSAAAVLSRADLRELLSILAFALLIGGLTGLTRPSSAIRGNRVAAAGMGIALLATLILPRVHAAGLIVAGVVAGTLVGVPAARLVKMTAMPQMVALFNGVGGGAVALIAWAEFRSSHGYADGPLELGAFSVFAALVGSVSFWGSLVAFGKLQELLPSRPIMLGVARAPLTVLAGAAAVGCAVVVVAGAREEALLVGLLVAAAALGLLLVLPIGGADMPVVISLLNAFTGLSAAATGMALDATAMIVAGMLVGASGTLLTREMANAMNRSVRAIVVGGFGATTDGAGPLAGGTVRSTTAADVALQLAYARLVVIVPGYGLAVSQAQHAVREMTKLLEATDVEVKYAIHPVAGRMPGHMDVLLAEADVPYDQLSQMDEINPVLPRADVALVLGANDVVNPDARANPASPLYGMPILDVDAARSIVVLKRSMRPGYAGVDNPLFVHPRTAMLFGDAKASVSAITQELKLLVQPAAGRGAG